MIILLNSVKEIEHRKFNRQKDDRHDRTGLGIVYGAIPPGPHNEGIDLMGGKNEGVGGGQSHHQGRHSRIAAGHDRHVHAQRNQEDRGADIGNHQGEKRGHDAHHRQQNDGGRMPDNPQNEFWAIKAAVPVFSKAMPKGIRPAKRNTVIQSTARYASSTESTPVMIMPRAPDMQGYGKLNLKKNDL